MLVYFLHGMLHACVIIVLFIFFFFFKQKTAYEMRISDWSSDVCSSDLQQRKRRCPATTQKRSKKSGSRSGTNARPFAPKPIRPGRNTMSSRCFPIRRDVSIWATCATTHWATWSRATNARAASTARKSGVEGKRVSVSVDLGGRRNIKKK